MDKYDPTSRCPKCDNNSVGSTFHSGVRCPYGCPRKYAATVEHLSRYCQRCHFEWVQATLDTPEPSKDGGK